jgi:cell division protease FtsH
MVCEYGMSEAIGPVAYGQEDEPIFIGKEIARHKDYSEATARLIDESSRKILDEARAHAESLLKEHRKELDILTEALLKHETLDDAEVRLLLGLPPAKEKTPDGTVVETVGPLQSDSTQSNPEKELP